MKEERRQGKSNQMDMIGSSLWRNIFLFAIPLALSSILQQLFNSVDVAVVGRFAGDAALGGVSANAAVTALFVNIFVGLSVGPNVVIAKYIGQERKQEIQDVIHTVMAFAFLVGFAMLILGQVIARPMLRLIATPDNVMTEALIYLRIYFVGLPFLITYNFGAAVLRSIGDTKRPMFCLFFSGVLNAVLNILLVVGVRMGVAGVAIATTASNAVSASIVVGLLLHEQELIRLHVKKIAIKKEYLKQILLVGMPAAVQSGVFSISNVVIQSGINYFGRNAISGSSVGLTFEYFTYYMINAFSQAAVTFTSQNYGARKLERCKKIAWICSVEGMALTAVMSAVFTIWGRPLTGLYTTNTVVIAYALIRMHHVMSIELLTGTYDITAGVLRGIGHSMLPAVLTILGSVCFRIVWIYVVFPQRKTFDMLMSVYPVSWILTGTMMVTAYVVVTRKVFRE